DGFGPAQLSPGELRGAESDLVGEDLRRKGLVHLDPVHVIELEPGSLQGFGSRESRAQAHAVWRAALVRVRADPAQGLHSQILGFLFTRDDQGAPPIRDGTGIADRDRPQLAVEERPELLKGLDGLVLSRPHVLRHGLEAWGSKNGNDLSVEKA